MAQPAAAGSAAPGAAFRIGEFVRVDAERRYGRSDSEGGVGYVTAADSSTRTVTVTWTGHGMLGGAGGAVERGILLTRLHPATLATPPRKHASPQPGCVGGNVATAVPAKVPDGASPLVAECFGWRPRASSTPHPLATCLRQGRRKKKRGWRRLEEHTRLNGLASGEPALNSQFSERETTAFVMEYMLLCGITGYERALGDLCFAWGRQPHFASRAAAKFAARCGPQRVQRSDTGKSILTDVEFAQSKASAWESYKHVKMAEYAAPAVTDIRTEWDSMSEQDRVPYQAAAERKQMRAPFVLNEATEVLRRTKGCISWRALANQIGNFCSPQALRQYFTSIEDFEYTSTGMAPELSPAHKKRRVDWACMFWTFWHSAKRVQLRVMLCHMDEKWFYACVVRKFRKRIVSIGVEPVDFRVTHKSHVYKTMAVAVSGFIPTGGDITAGGHAVKIAFERVGRMAPAVRDSFRRVYSEDGKSFTYTGDRLREKGQLYWKNLEITGSSEGTATKPKFSLLALHRDNIIPAMEKLAAERNVVIRYQMDQAGPHTDGRFMAYMNKEFDSRGWMFEFQPSQSPITNVKDACIFPTLSKDVSQQQAIAYGSHVLQDEELWRAAESSWANMPLSTIARAYAGHHQIVTAILEHAGSNEFLRQRGGMHYGIRKRYAATEEGVDVVFVDTTANDIDASVLKYEPPDYDGESFNKLDEQEQRCIASASANTPAVMPTRSV